MTLRLFLVLLLGLVTSAFSEPGRNFTGHYELAKSGSKAFALQVKQKERQAKISFSAGHEDGSGAAPDGHGKGRVNAQDELALTFTDSYGNTGSALLRRAGAGYRLTIKMNKVEEPRALFHYGTLTLKRTSAKPQTDDR